MEARLKQCNGTLLNPKLSIEEKRSFLDGLLTEATSGVGILTLTVALQEFYDRILKARFDPFAQVLQSHGRKWGQVVSQAASAKYINAMLGWALQGMNKSAKADTVLLCILEGLLLNDATMLGSNSIPLVIETLLAFKPSDLASTTSYLEIWRHLKRKYPLTIRSNLAKMAIVSAETDTRFDGAFAEELAAQWRDVDQMVCSEFIDLLLIKLRFIQDQPDQLARVLFHLNHLAAVYPIDARRCTLLKKSILHVNYKTTSDSLFKQLLNFADAHQGDPAALPCIQSQLLLSISKCKDLGEVITSFVASRVALELFEQCITIGGPFMSIRRVLISQQNFADANNCIKFLSDNGANVDTILEIEVEQLEHALKNCPSSPQVLKPSDKICLLSAFPKDVIASIFVEDLKYLNPLVRESIFLDAEFMRGLGSHVLRLENADLQYADPAYAHLLSQSVSQETLRALIQRNAPVSQLLPFVDDENLSNEAYTSLLQYFEAHSEESLSAHQLKGRKLREMIHLADDKFSVSALKLWLRLGLKSSAIESSIGPPSPQFPFPQWIAPWDVEKVGLRLVPPLLTEKPGRVEGQLEKLMKHTGYAPMIVRAVQNTRAVRDLSYFYNFDAWYEKNRKVLLPILISARLFPLAYYVLTFGTPLTGCSPADLTALISWCHHTEQTHLRDSLIKTYGEVKLLDRPSLAEIVKKYDPLGEHPLLLRGGEKYGTDAFEEEDLEFIHISLKSSGAGLSDDFVAQLKPLALLWDERWLVLLKKIGQDLSTTTSLMASMKASVEQAKKLFGETFGSRIREKTPYEKKLQKGVSIAIHELIDALAVGNSKVVKDKLQWLISTLSAEKPKPLSLDEAWPAWKSYFIQNHVYLDGKKIVKIEGTMQCIPSKSFPKQVKFNFEDRTSQAFLLKNGNLEIERRVSDMISLMARICDIEIIVPKVLPLSPECGLVEWVQARSCFDVYAEVPEISVEAFRKVGGDVAEFAKLVPKNRLLSLFYQATPEAGEIVERRMSQVLAFHCCVQYILGLGDRHLGNILVGDRNLIQIDLGLCLDEGSRLAVPECVPFRFTPAFQELIGPHHQAFFRETFAGYMGCLRQSDYLIRGALQEWIDSPTGRFTLPLPELVEGVLAKIKSTGSDLDRIDALVREASRPSNLQAMYDGWQPWI